MAADSDRYTWTGACAIRAPLNPAKLLREPTASAWTALGKLEPGVRLVGLTRGQFSLLDLIRAVIEQTGPADLTVAAWAVGARDAETSGWLLDTGQLRSLRLLVAYGFHQVSPDYAARLVELYGPEAILLCRSHAKFAIIKNERWRIVIRCSMNLNRNTRFEQFDLDDCPEICGLFEQFVDDVAAATPAGIEIEYEQAAIGMQAGLARGGAVDVGAVDVESMLREIDIGATLAELGGVDVDQLVREAFGHGEK